MWFRRLYIRYKIWSVQSKIKNISSEIDFYLINLVTLNIKYLDGKADIEKIYSNFLNIQKQKKRSLLQELENLKIILKKL